MTGDGSRTRVAMIIDRRAGKFYGEAGTTAIQVRAGRGVHGHRVDATPEPAFRPFRMSLYVVASAVRRASRIRDGCSAAFRIGAHAVTAVDSTGS